MFNRIITSDAPKWLPHAGRRAGHTKMPAAAQVPQAETQQKAQVIGVLGAKGGAGATTVAINLAAAYSAAGLTTTLIDANFQNPDVACALGVEPQFTVCDLFEKLHALDQSIFNACCSTPLADQPNFKLLTPPLNGRAAVTYNLTNVAEAVEQTGAFTQACVIDLPKHLDKHFVTATDACDKVLLIFEASVSSITMMSRWLTIFKELGYTDDRIVTVLNRAGGKFSAVEKQLDKCLGDRKVIALPNASAIMFDCAARGLPAVTANPRHPYSRAVSLLCSALHGRDGDV